jgi:hypothetical protein
MSHTAGEDNHVKIIVALNEKNSKKATPKNLSKLPPTGNCVDFLGPLPS